MGISGNGLLRFIVFSVRRDRYDQKSSNARGTWDKAEFLQFYVFNGQIFEF